MVIRLGIIGLSADPQAWAIMAHVPPIKGPLASYYKITAGATSTPGTAKASAKAHGLPQEKGYSNPTDIANDPEVDMVVVSVKPPIHKQLTMPALKAKKDFLVEWPLGSGLKEAQEMAELAKKQGVRYFVGLQARMSPAFAKIVQSGVLGRITSTTVLGSDSQLMNFPEKARYINDPTSGRPHRSPLPVDHPNYIPPASNQPSALPQLPLGVPMVSIPVVHTPDLSHRPTAITHPSIRFISPTGSFSSPEPKRHADNITVSSLLTPGDAVLDFQYLITAPATPSMF
ncbi:MAG: hypothetical protein L6R42_006089 [Xanthoria sp. 1 TBL-2021]|nr:MAG: hypothetical protein L6R42_006089 [Xanthoria sp. 1 TBL-2021]